MADAVDSRARNIHGPLTNQYNLIFYTQDVKRNIKRYYGKFQLEDRMRESKASKEQIDQRRKAMEEYRLWRENVEQEFMAEKEERLTFRNGKVLFTPGESQSDYRVNDKH